MNADSDDLRELYQELILDHYRHPVNFRRIDDATAHVEGDNPLCGDRLEVFVKLDGDRIEDVSFQGSGCAISVASASLLCERLVGATVADAEALIEGLHDLLISPDAEPDEEALGKLAALAGVRQYPSRIKCATLSGHALKAALHGDKSDTVSTE